MRLFVLLLCLSFCLPVRAQDILVYHAYWMGDVWHQYDLQNFRRLFFFELPVDADGRVRQRHGWPQRWQALRTQAAADGVPVDPVVSLLGTSRFVEVFGSEAATANLLDACIALAREAGGLHLDVEVFDTPPAAAVAAFGRFLRDLRQAMNAPPRGHLSGFVPARSPLYAAGSLAVFDQVVVQGYDVNWPSGPRAGPIAQLDGDSPAAWRTAADILLAQGIAAPRIYFSSPLYGYEWPVSSTAAGATSRGPARTVTFAPVSPDLLPEMSGSALMRVLEHGWRRDAATQAPWYQFRARDGHWQGWFDDPVSLRRRLDYLTRGRFGGVAFFVLGYDGGVLVRVAREAFRGSAERPRDTRPEFVR